MHNCTYHCGNCRRHFHSLRAFDLHRQGDYASADPELGRRCVSPIDVFGRDGQERLEVLTEDGICRVYAEEHGVTIWTEAGSRERVAACRGDAPVGGSQPA